MRLLFAFVSHAGSGSVVGALGVARVLDAVHVTAAEVGRATAAVLSTASYRERSERLRDEIAALPDAAYAVTLLEDLAGK